MNKNQSDDKKQLTNRDKLTLLLFKLNLSHHGYTGRIEINMVQGGIRSIMKHEAVEIAD